MAQRSGLAMRRLNWLHPKPSPARWSRWWRACSCSIRSRILLQAALNTGDPEARPPTEYGLDNFAGLLAYPQIILNTLTVSLAATVMALVLGFVMAWIITRTNVPGRRFFEQMMVVPYYLTPLLGALAWSLLGTPESGFLNQVFRALGGKEYLIDINTPYGIAWVMALFEGSVAFVMIGAVMKSMDPALEEASQVMGASRLRTMLRDHAAAGAARRARRRGVRVRRDARLVRGRARARPAEPLLRGDDRDLSAGAAISAEDSGRGRDGHLAVRRDVRDAVHLPPHHHGRQLRDHHRQGVPPARQRRRPAALRCCCAICVFYLFCSVVLPLLTLFYASIQKISTAFPAASNFTTEHFYKAFTMNAATTALGNSLWLALWTATLGVLLMGLISWIIYRSRLPGASVIEYIVMFPQSVPRLIFAFGMMWAWLIFPIPIYGTLWLLLIAYLTVFLPLGVRTISGVMLQIDKSLEECAQMCGAGWGYRIRTVTVPLLWPGLIAAWLLLFVASIRELGASILLMGPHSKVITPSIVESWFASSTELTAAMALIQTLVVAIAVSVLIAVTRRATDADYGLDHMADDAQAAHRGRESRNPLRRRAGGARRELFGAAGRAADAARAVGLRQDHDLARDRRASNSRARAKSASAARRSIRRRSASTSRPRSAASRWCSSPTRSGRT